jgi:hypothetical protein
MIAISRKRKWWTAPSRQMPNLSYRGFELFCSSYVPMSDVIFVCGPGARTEPPGAVVLARGPGASGGRVTESLPRV